MVTRTTHPVSSTVMTTYHEGIASKLHQKDLSIKWKSFLCMGWSFMKCRKLVTFLRFLFLCDIYIEGKVNAYDNPARIMSCYQPSYWYFFSFGRRFWGCRSWRRWHLYQGSVNNLTLIDHWILCKRLSSDVLQFSKALATSTWSCSSSKLHHTSVWRWSRTNMWSYSQAVQKKKKVKQDLTCMTGDKYLAACFICPTMFKGFENSICSHHSPCMYGHAKRNRELKLRITLLTWHGPLFSRKSAIKDVSSLGNLGPTLIWRMNINEHQVLHAPSVKRTFPCQCSWTNQWSCHQAF